MNHKEQLRKELQGITDDEMAQFSPEEMDRIEATLSGGADLTGATSQPSEQMRALSTLSPLVDPVGVLQPQDTFEDKSEPSINLENTGSMAGSVVGGLRGAQLGQNLTAPFPAPVRGLGTLAGGAIGTFLGATGGDLAESAVKSGMGMDSAPEGLQQAFKQAVDLGSEEAVLDVGLNAVFGAAGKGAKLLRAQANELAPKVKALLEQGGSKATLGQLTNNVMYTGIEKMTRGALFGGSSFSALDILQDDAIVKYTNEYVEKFAGVAAEELTDTAAGKLIIDVVEGGKEAHRLAAKPLYEAVDALADGLKVDVSGVKRIAQKRLDELSRTRNIGKTTEGGDILDKAATLDESLSFTDAQALRSDLLERARGLSETKSDQAVARNISDMVTAIDNQFDAAVKSGGVNKEAAIALRKANRFWRFGKDNFNNKIIKSLLSRDDLVSKIAPKVFRAGNIDEVHALRRAVKAASKVDETLDFNKVWGKMQGGYLRSLLPSTVDDVAKADILRLHKDKKVRKTLIGAFTKNQRDDILEMSRVLDQIVTSRGASTGLLNLRQMGFAVQGVSSGFVASQAGLGEGAAVLTLPLLFSSIATNPRAAKLFLRWAKEKRGTALKVTALTKLASHLGVREEVIDPEGVTSRPEDKASIENQRAIGSFIGP